jgi:hypothetical protein
MIKVTVDPEMIPEFGWTVLLATIDNGEPLFRIADFSAMCQLVEIDNSELKMECLQICYVPTQQNVLKRTTAR